LSRHYVERRRTVEFDIQMSRPWNKWNQSSKNLLSSPDASFQLAWSIAAVRLCTVDDHSGGVRISVMHITRLGHFGKRTRSVAFEFWTTFASPSGSL